MYQQRLDTAGVRSINIVSYSDAAPVLQNAMDYTTVVTVLYRSDQSFLYRDVCVIV